MKVIAFNGSPNKKGNTFLLIKHTLDILEKAGIETEIVQIGGKNIHPCTACHKCRENQDKKMRSHQGYRERVHRKND